MSDLSPRLSEVAALVAEGLSDKAIAKRLCLSLRTVERYVHMAAKRAGGAGKPRVALTRWWLTRAA